LLYSLFAVAYVHDSAGSGLSFPFNNIKKHFKIHFFNYSFYFYHSNILVTLKTLLIIRHAKAETIFTLNDFERPLNERGKADAPVMAKRLLQKKIKIDAFVSSPARRAKKTAELFCAIYGLTDEDIIYVSALYHAPAAVFFEVVGHLDESFNTVALFAHNPGITHFANELAPEFKLDNMPTCAVFIVQADIDRWPAFHKAKKEFLFFDYPKNV
jgi:phosphohistidine phosphatase